jgi:hypothetical protein
LVSNWNRIVSQLPSNDLAQYLQDEIRRQWPEDLYPYHIEVIAQQTNRITVRIWNAHGVEIEKEAFPERFLASPHKSPTAAAVFHALELAIVAAQGHSGAQPRG